MKMSAHPTTLFGVALLSFFVTPNLRGEFITFEFEGSVTESSSLLDFHGIQNIDVPEAGVPIYGRYTFDSTAENTSDSEQSGDYLTASPNGSFSISIGQFELQSDSNEIHTRQSQYIVEASDLTLVSPAELVNVLETNDFFLSTTIDFQLGFEKNDLLENLDLPLTPPLVTAPPFNTVFVSFDDRKSSNPFINITGTVESLTIIPEPSYSLLLASGLLLGTAVVFRSFARP